MRKLKIPFASAVRTLVISAASLSGMISAPVANAYAAQGSWSPTASLPEARAGHSAVLLLDGTVLVAGPDQATLLFDAATGTWTRTDNNSSGARLLTLLNDGRVLAVAGGPGVSLPGGDETRAELFDPKTDTWTSTGGMSHGRRGHTATLLNDGRVLVAGGMYCGRFGCFSPPPPQYVPAELFDPSTGTWSRTGDMMRQHEGGQSATLLSDGRVLVEGGVPGCVGSSAEIFDPSTETWTLTGDMIGCGGMATLLANGKVLVVGGLLAVLYDPGTDTWSETASPTDSRANHTATPLVGGNVLVAGGAVDCPIGGDTPQLNTSEEYDPGMGSWGSRTFMSTGRYAHTATLLNDGRVLVAGGVARVHDDFGEGCFVTIATETAEIYAPTK